MTNFSLVLFSWKKLLVYLCGWMHLKANSQITNMLGLRAICKICLLLTSLG